MNDAINWSPSQELNLHLTVINHLLSPLSYKGKNASSQVVISAALWATCVAYIAAGDPLLRWLNCQRAFPCFRPRMPCNKKPRGLSPSGSRSLSSSFYLAPIPHSHFVFAVPGSVGSAMMA